MTILLWPRWASIEQYWLHVGFMGFDKPSCLVTTWSNRNRYSKADRREGKWGSPDDGRAGRARNQDFIMGVEERFRPCRDFVTCCCTWGPRDRMYDVLVRFFPYNMYIDLNRRHILRFEWRLFAASSRSIYLCSSWWSNVFTLWLWLTLHLWLWLWCLLRLLLLLFLLLLYA
jgi:hypothetical protein